MPHMATCEHIQVGAATLQIRISPPHIARSSYFLFLEGPFPTLRLFRKAFTHLSGKWSNGGEEGREEEV